MIPRRDFVTRLPLALFGAAVATTFGTGAFAQDSRTVTVAFPMDILSWDPVTLNPTQSAIIKCVYDQPLELAPDLKFGPSVVSDFKWLNKNCTLLELSFRDGVTFHNGDKLTAADFKFSFFDRPRAQKASLLAGVWSAIESIEVPTPLKAVVKFSAPMAIAPVMFADIPAYILPKAYYEKVGKDGFEARPIGSGPYKLVEYQRDQRIVLEAYEGYWRGPAKVKRLVFQVTKDPTARAAAIQSGQADLTMNIPVREAERLGALPGLAPHLDSTTGVIFLQMANKGILTDRNVRLACHHAIDKVAISKALFGSHATAVYMPAGPGFPAYVPDFKVAFDPAKAKALLAASGYNAANPVKLNFYTSKGVFASDFDLARVIAQMWQKVGIEVNLQVLDSPTLYEYQRIGKFDGPVLKPFNPAAGDPGTYSGYMLDPKMSFSIWKGDDIPPKLYPLMGEPDYAKRMEGFKTFDMWQVEQGYSIPLFLGLSTIVAKRSLGFRPYKSGILIPYDWA